MFTKNALKTGMVVELKGGKRYLVLVGGLKTSHYGKQEIAFVGDEGFLIGTDYKDDLTTFLDTYYNIDKVFDCPIRQFSDMLEIEDDNLIWERKEVDWSTVKVDTPILVRDVDTDDWHKRYFKEYQGGKVFAFTDGRTSFSSIGIANAWNYAVLYEGNEELV